VEPSETIKLLLSSFADSHEFQRLEEDLTNFLGSIKVIQGYLKISGTSIQSLNFFKELHSILGEELYMKK